MKNLALVAVGFGIGAACVRAAYSIGIYQGVSIMIHADSDDAETCKNVVEEAEDKVREVWGAK